NNKLDALFKGKKIKIPNVIYEQVRYIKDLQTRERKTIRFQKYINNGSLEIIDNPITDDMDKIRNSCKQCSEIAEIHPGEIECIALLRQNTDYGFCTGDRTAMKVLGFWHLSEQAVSLEGLVGKMRNLRDNFTKKYMKKYLNEGSNLWVKYGWK
ncbi:hypothetical protein KAW48_07155, partial [candidate division WOR-3 bacterium]|nr:hypothetical protein [candidate division WOR-3 bacterium]